MNKQRLLETLERHEGMKLKPYRDTVGKLTIGIGRNLDDVGISKSEAYAMLTNDLIAAETDARALVPNFDEHNDARQEVLVNMAFNMGRASLGTFTNTLKAIREKRYDAAADGMLASKWASQVKGRATELARVMREGKW